MLGLWAGEQADGEGAKFWLRVLAEIKNRGTRDVASLPSTAGTWVITAATVTDTGATATRK